MCWLLYLQKKVLTQNWQSYWWRKVVAHGYEKSLQQRFLKMLSHLFNIFIIYIQQEYHCQGWVEYVWVRLKAMATTKAYFCRSEEVSTWRGREDDPVGHCWFCSKYYHPASSCKKTDYNDRCSQNPGIAKNGEDRSQSWNNHFPIIYHGIAMVLKAPVIAAWFLFWQTFLYTNRPE